MKHPKDWPIRYKLTLPLLAIMVLGGAGIFSTFAGVYDQITAHALPQERALDGIRRSSLDLLGEYREFMLVPSEWTQREIDALKEEIEVYEAAFERSARPGKAQSSAVAAIEVSEQGLKLLGDQTIVLRRRLLNQIEALEPFETEIENLPAGGPLNAESGDVMATGTGAAPIDSGEDLEPEEQLKDHLHEYLSELREYLLAPSAETRREIVEIEHSLEQYSRASSDGNASGAGNQVGNTDEDLLVRRVLETGRLTVALADDFLISFEALEEKEDELLEVLEEAGSMIAGDTDEAFEIGFAAVATVILVVLALIFLVGFGVSQGIAKRVSVLAKTANRLGGGDLSARADMASKDEIGVLAASFNWMAGSLETNVELLEHAEQDLKALNEELEQRVNERTAELRTAQQGLVRKERLAALGQLTATVSHELRNPLGTIRTSLFTVDERTRDKGLGVERAIGRIERNIARCDGIINELLDFSRVRELNRDATKIDDWLERTLGELALPEGIVLERELAAGVSLAIDRERLRRVLINILDNACHATVEANGAGGTVTVSSRVHDGRLEVSVADSGPGVPDGALPKIFEPLYSTKAFGVGLGLPLVKQILEQHGGGIEIGNRENGGARVLLWLGMDQMAEGAQA